MRPNGAVGVLVLAAGSSSRLGQPKQLLPLGRGGTTLLRHAAQVALEAGGAVAVVLGANHEAIGTQTADLPVLTVHNDDWAQGMATSIGAGLRALTVAQPDMDAVIVMLCDQPLLTVQTLNALIAAHRTTGLPVAASHYGNETGAPCLFHRSLFGELFALTGSEGAKRVIVRQGASVALVPFPGGEWDVDTPADAERAREKIAA